MKPYLAKIKYNHRLRELINHAYEVYLQYTKLIHIRTRYIETNDVSGLSMITSIISTTLARLTEAIVVAYKFQQPQNKEEETKWQQ
jgi:hypothetical protein